MKRERGRKKIKTLARRPLSFSFFLSLSLFFSPSSLSLLSFFSFFLSSFFSPLFFSHLFFFHPTLKHQTTTQTDEPQAQKMTLVADLKTFPDTVEPALPLQIQCLTLVQAHYPERMGRAVVGHAPAMFWLMWKAVTPSSTPSRRPKWPFAPTTPGCGTRRRPTSASSSSTRPWGVRGRPRAGCCRGRGEAAQAGGGEEGAAGGYGEEDGDGRVGVQARAVGWQGRAEKGRRLLRSPSLGPGPGPRKGRFWLLLSTLSNSLSFSSLPRRRGRIKEERERERERKREEEKRETETAFFFFFEAERERERRKKKREEKEKKKKPEKWTPSLFYLAKAAAALAKSRRRSSLIYDPNTCLICKKRLLAFLAPLTERRREREREKKERRRREKKKKSLTFSLSLLSLSVVVGERRKIIALPSLVFSTLPSVIAASAWTARSRRCVAREAQKKIEGKVDWFDPKRSSSAIEEKNH